MQSIQGDASENAYSLDYFYNELWFGKLFFEYLNRNTFVRYTGDKMSLQYTCNSTQLDELKSKNHKVE